MAAPPDPRRRARWLKTLHQWHWISSAVSLAGLLLFSVTGITLNHAASIEATPVVDTRVLVLPTDLAERLTRFAVDAGSAARTPANRARAAAPRPAPSLPDEVVDWIATRVGVDVRGRDVEWGPDEAYVALPRPGGDAWLRITLPDGELTHERTDRGWVSYLNDLHKGRHVGASWSAFIDVFAVACLLFAITGLLILKLHAANRPATWPLTGLGLLLPALIAILFIH